MLLKLIVYTRDSKIIAAAAAAAATAPKLNRAKVTAKCFAIRKEVIERNTETFQQSLKWHSLILAGRLFIYMFR